MTNMKRGRPRLETDDENLERRRGQWRKASKRYYRENRESVLRKAHEKTCVGNNLEGGIPG